MLKTLLRPHIFNLTPYSTARDEYSGEARVFLDANENPYGDGLNRYPDPRSDELRSIIAKIRGVEKSQVFVGNGSDEAIDLIIRAVASPGEAIAITPPTYGMYGVAARTNGVGVFSAPLKKDFSLDFELIKIAADNGAKALFLCSPNNPTGNQLPLADIQRVLDLFPGLVVVDEAYIDFASGPSAVGLLESRDRLVVLQTMSKAWCLAGARVGMALASRELIGVLNRIKLPYNVNQLSQSAAIKRLLDIESFKSQVRSIIEERERLRSELTDKIAGILEVFPSEANFLLVRCERPCELFKGLQSSGIIVRDRSKEPLCDGCLRITVGTPRENDELIEVIRRWA
jgi:histidinol-phosphate aminotransferase